MLSFKLEFSCSNNTAEYEAYITGLATTLEIGINHLKVMGDSNLVVCQTKGSSSLKEPSLAPYRAMTQKMEEKLSTFEIEHTPRNENQFADALAAWGSQIPHWCSLTSPAIATSLGSSSSNKNSSSPGNCVSKSAIAWLFTALGVPAFKLYYDNCSNHWDILPERIGYRNKALIAWDLVISHTS